MTACVRRITLACVCLFISAAPLFAGERQRFASSPERPFPVAYAERIFAAAIEGAASVEAAAYHATGLVLPHHLLAADLIAEGFAIVRKGRYSRIVILSPDHFNRGRTPFSVPGRDFLVSRGTVRLDRDGAEALMRNELVSKSNLFSHEHGVQALLPFIAHHFPAVPVLPVAIGRDSSSGEWRSLAASLLPLTDSGTLIVQSTDFSHYLDREETARKDAESLAVLLSGDPERVLLLRQPANIDSRGALFIQMSLQKAIGSVPVIMSRSSSFEYDLREAEKSGGTSYITAVFSNGVP